MVEEGEGERERKGEERFGCSGGVSDGSGGGPRTLGVYVFARSRLLRGLCSLRRTGPAVSTAGR